MKEISSILDAVAGLDNKKQALLATVLDVRGSSYRLPGARMLLLDDGQTVGTVSGGCLENDVLERARKIIAGGRSEVYVYDTTGDQDSVFSMNMGCRGVIRILLESVDRNSLIIDRLDRSRKDRETQYIATLIADNSDHPVGGRAFLNGSLGFESYGLSPLFEEAGRLPKALDEFAASGISYASREVETAQGRYEFAFERVLPPISLLIFGAGADAVPLAGMAAELGWQTTVIDHRPAYLTAERFPTANDLLLLPRDEPVADTKTDHRTAVVIMTHDYSRDINILPAMLRSEAFYVGALGPKSRTRQLLTETSVTTGSQKLFAPVGLDIGADTPEGIALAVLAEIQTVLGERSGGHLREREGSIYDRG